MPVDTLPGVLRTIAEWNPVTTVSESLRELFGNPTGEFGSNPPWSLQHPILYSSIWIMVIVVVCAPLAIRSYQRIASD